MLSRKREVSYLKLFATCLWTTHHHSTLNLYLPTIGTTSPNNPVRSEFPDSPYKGKSFRSAPIRRIRARPVVEPNCSLLCLSQKIGRYIRKSRLASNHRKNFLASRHVYSPLQNKHFECPEQLLRRVGPTVNPLCPNDRLYSAEVVAPSIRTRRS